MVEEKGRQTADKKEGRNPWTLREFGGKTLWDWLQLLIVPVVLSLITVVFAWQQDIRQDQIENKRAAAEREVAKQRAQDEALQAYLDQMSGLLLERDLRASKVDSEVRTLARVRTLTVLERLDPNRKRAVMQFITEAGLVQGSLNQKALMSGSTGRKEVSERVPVISLSGADLSGADLSDLGGSGSLYVASSRGTYSYVSGFTNLSGADLTSADLSGANLEEADLSNANLDQANLSNANLEEADLSGTFLRGANLKGATMPSGQKYED